MTPQEIAARLEELRATLRTEDISMGELIELQDLAEHIGPDDVELLEAAGVPEMADERTDYFVRRLAAIGYAAMETATRPDGTGYTRKRDTAPAWVGELIRAAHGDMFPDDYRYATIREAFSAIEDSTGDLEDAGTEFADNADVYNSDLLSWVGSSFERAGYVDEAKAEFGEPRDFYHGLQMGQYTERAEIYSAVLSGLRDAVAAEGLVPA